MKNKEECEPIQMYKILKNKLRYRFKMHYWHFYWVSGKWSMSLTRRKWREWKEYQLGSKQTRIRTLALPLSSLEKVP